VFRDTPAFGIAKTKIYFTGQECNVMGAITPDYISITLFCARERRLTTGSRAGKFDTTRCQPVCLSNPLFRLG
jgi:hypothetical protein